MTEVPQLSDKLRLRRIADLLPYARNARIHSDDQVKEIAASMAEFGYTNPVLADSKGIVAGHGRVLGASLLYAADQPILLPNGEALPPGTIPVIDCEGWSETKRKAYILADNKIALNADWDLSMLKVELAELREEGFDLSLTGFDDAELADLFTEESDPGDKDPDAVPDTPVEPHSKPGDVWICGPHRVMCGDSLAMTDWDKLMGDEQADLVWTDPPYNVAYESKLAGSIKNDDMGDDQFKEFLISAFSCLFVVMKPGAPIYVAHADLNGMSAYFVYAMKSAAFHIQNCLIWRKSSIVLGRCDYQAMHEPILYGWKPGNKHRWFGGRKTRTIFDLDGESPFEKLEDGRYAIRSGDRILIVSGDATVEELESSIIFHDKPQRSADHPTTKPVGLITKMLKNSGRHNDIVVDAFGGSGSTMIAAEMMGMCARLMELDPKFTDVQCRRYFEFTGRHAIHAETGLPFPSVAA